MTQRSLDVAAEPGGAAAATGRLRWRCRRGLKELDVLLERFVQRVLPEASGEDCRVYGELLELPDPLLLGYLLGHDIPAEPHLARALGRVRALCRLHDRSGVFCP
ncbi:MAG TPA: succinate dehydrogenase assembly factor 2 [Steroidobacteraceae bacterium]|nr:succinate dehydrogenase assembly factor 2 [Steroidobacteraceae bacterium]